MIIHFSINFRTAWGQNLYISGSVPELGEAVTRPRPYP